MSHHQPGQRAPSTQQQQQQQQPEEQNPYPVGTSIAATIFTPISGDELTAPFNPPSNRIDLLHSKIAALSENAKRVRANMHEFMSRECKRILWDARHEAEQLKAVGDGDKVNKIGSEVVSEEELDYTIEHLMARGDGQPRAKGEKPVELPNIAPLLEREGISFREKYTLLIEMTISQGLVDLDGYEKHVQGIRQEYKEALEREMQRDEAMDLD